MSEAPIVYRPVHIHDAPLANEMAGHDLTHPQILGDAVLMGIIRVLVDRLGGRASIERYEVRTGCQNPPLIVRQVNGDVLVAGES